MHLFTDGIFNDKCHIRLQDVERRHTKCIRKDAEGSGRGLLSGRIPERAWKDRGRPLKMSVMLVDATAEIRNLNLPSIRQQR